MHSNPGSSINFYISCPWFSSTFQSPLSATQSFSPPLKVGVRQGTISLDNCQYVHDFKYLLEANASQVASPDLTSHLIFRLMYEYRDLKVMTLIFHIHSIPPNYSSPSLSTSGQSTCTVFKAPNPEIEKDHKMVKAFFHFGFYS